MRNLEDMSVAELRAEYNKAAQERHDVIYSPAPLSAHNTASKVMCATFGKAAQLMKLSRSGSEDQQKKAFIELIMITREFTRVLRSAAAEVN
ncbi:hypothetical protein KJ652_05785 [Patescibacteria group bacterium]|nr:hypothetical protein [Patescibacteria group bacterium]MBU1124072.1 hypothetical protein [Patescibacteria group bacterium]MBU1911292.1 hypothetical protein [Patescibacteria group bacterium]